MKCVQLLSLVLLCHIWTILARDSCALSSNNCTEEHSEVGCNICEVQNCVCNIVPQCCTARWSSSCASILNDFCTPLPTSFSPSSTTGSCALSEENCYSSHEHVGCIDCCVQGCVCSKVSECCLTQWKSSCALVAREWCTQCPYNTLTEPQSSTTSSKEYEIEKFKIEDLWTKYKEPTVITIIACGAFLISVFVLSCVLFVTRRRSNRKVNEISDLEITTPTKAPAVLYGDLEDTSIQKFQEEIISKWSKNFEQLPVHVDLPRLVTAMEIRVNETEVFPLEELSIHQKKETLVLHFLTLMASILDSDELAEEIAEKFPDYFSSTEYTDISRHLQPFLIQVVGDDSRVGRVLKAANQAVVAPAILRLKRTIANLFPFKDVNRQWKILIDVHPDEVRVVHSKWEQSHQENSFQFKWELEMVFPPSMKRLKSVTLLITELKFGSSDTNAVKKELKKVMAPFLLKAFLVEK